MFLSKYFILFSSQRNIPRDPVGCQGKGPIACLQGPGTNSMSHNKNQDKGLHHQADEKRKHPSDD